MTNSAWMKLKSGTDIRGTAMGENALLTPETAGRIAHAFGEMVRQGRAAGSCTVTVGHDTRLTGPALAQGVVNGLAAAGVCPVLAGVATTPAMDLTCLTGPRPADGAVMVTASHHPKEKNGLKFYTPCGGLGGQEITRLLTRAEELPAPPPAKSLYRPVLHDYAALLLERVRRLTGRIRPLQGKRILVDAGGGAGGFFAIDVIAPLGADVRGSLRLSPDGTFSGRDPNPEKEEALHGLREAVCRQKADLGIAFDPDGDRVALVDRDGDLLHRNRLIALVAATLAEQNPGGVIVTDSVTSDGLPEFLAAHGLHHRRFKRGYKNVIDEAKRLCAQGLNAPLAMETSGHAALREHWFLDDGAYLAARLLASLVLLDREGKTLGDLVTSLREPAESVERRIALTERDFHAQGSRLLKALAELVERNPDFAPETENHEGLRVRVNGPHRGWFLLRASLHDPVLVLNLESDSEGGVRWMEQQLASLFEA